MIQVFSYTLCIFCISSPDNKARIKSVGFTVASFLHKGVFIHIMFSDNSTHNPFFKVDLEKRFILTKRTLHFLVFNLQSLATPRVGKASSGTAGNAARGKKRWFSRQARRLTGRGRPWWSHDASGGGWRGAGELESHGRRRTGPRCGA